MKMQALTPDLPTDFWLLDGERLIPEKTSHHDKRVFNKVPSSLEQIMRLTSARSPRTIGKNGPSIAALALENYSRPTLLPKLKNIRPRSAQSQQTPEHLRLYEVIFGRDSLRVAIDLISTYPSLARATTLKLAQLQGLEFVEDREEEPGRIVHEARDKDDRRAQEISEQLGWGWPYYGSVDATPEFVRTVAAYCARSVEKYSFLKARYTDRMGKTHSMDHAIEMALEWIIGRLDSNEEGLLEYQTTLPHGIENQVWKDSPDAYHHADGTVANHGNGIASIEVQVTTYDAFLDAAEMYDHIPGGYVKAAELRKRAETLRTAIFELLWTDDKGGYFVLGTDRDDDGLLRQLKVRTSNMGHTLNSRLLEGDDPDIVHKRESVIRHILSPEMLNISGIRTLANDEVRFRPGAYHNGTVWLWDTHHIAKGLRRHGHTEEARELDRRLLRVVEITKMFPEYARGGNDMLPTLNEYTITVWDSHLQREMCVEQPPQEVQAWTVAAILAIKKRMDREERSIRNPFDKINDKLQTAGLPFALPTQLNPIANLKRPKRKL